MSDRLVNIIPTSDRVYVERDPKPDKTAGGLYVPDTATPAGAVRAKVLSVGPGRVTMAGVLVEPRVRVGDRVVLAHDHVDVMVTPHESMPDRVIVREDSIIAVLEPVS